jgi:hypothetical protein
MVFFYQYNLVIISLQIFIKKKFYPPPKGGTAWEWARILLALFIRRQAFGGNTTNLRGA